MTFSQFISPLNRDEFLERHLRKKKPYSASGRFDFFRALNPKALVYRLLAQSSDCALPKDGLLPVEAEGRFKRIDREKAMRAFAQGRTILIRKADAHDDFLANLAQDFSAAANGPVDLQVYFTPASTEGFNWHYDAEEVFILQVAGSKEFFLRRNTINPQPIYSQMHKDLRFEAETSEEWTRCLLLPGDVLYIPAGYWHKAMAHEDSLHFSIGVYRG